MVVRECNPTWFQLFFFSIFLIIQSVHKDFQELTLALDGERYRAERLEEQVNDLTELHQVNTFILIEANHIINYYYLLTE